MINLQLKVTKSRKFLLFTTIYLVISHVAFLLPGGGYSFIFFFYIIGSFYLFIWCFFAIICATSKQVRYSRASIYFILFIQTIAVLFNIPDSGYYGITCYTKNFVQSFFDRSRRCNGLWMSHEIYMPILCLYLLLVVGFVFNVLWLTKTDNRSR